MKDKNILISFLLSSLLYSVSSQSQDGDSGSVDNFSISNTSFQSLLSTSTKQSVSQLETNPENLDAVLENIAQATIGEIEKIANAIISQKGIKPEALAIEIGEAVNSSLVQLTLVESLESFDFESVGLQVEDAVKQLFEDMGKNSSSEKVTEDLGNIVIEAIGDGLSKTMGATYSFKVSMKEGSTPVPPPPQLSPVASNFLRLLRSGDVDGVVKAMLKQIQQTGDLNTIFEFLLVVAENPDYYSSMSEVFAIFFGDGNSPIQQLSDILGPVYERNSNIATILAEAIVKASSKNQVEGLVPLITVAFTGQGPLNDVMLKSVDRAIAMGGCNPFLGDVLSRSKEIADETDNASAFQSSIVSSANASSCLTEGLKNQFAFQIVAKLSEGDIDTAYESIKSSQVSTIVTSFVLAIAAGYESGVSELLVKFFEDDTITPRILTVMIATFMKQEGVNATQILIDSILRTRSQQNLVDTFIYAFTKANSKEFLDLVVASIKKKECSLTNIVGGVLASSTQKEAKQITKILEEGNAEICIPPTPIPVPEIITPSPSAFPSPQLEQFKDLTKVPFPTLPPVVAATPKDSVVKSAVQKAPQELVQQSEGKCSNIPPPGDFSCSQQVLYGKCVRKWMRDNGFCAASCGFCCDDIAPTGPHNCQQQKEFGKCDTAWMVDGGFCRKTCGVCNLSSETTTQTPQLSVPSPTPTLPPTPTPIPTPNPTPKPAPSPTPTPLISVPVSQLQPLSFLEPMFESDENSECGCSTEDLAKLSAGIVEEVVAQVLQALQQN